MANSGLTEIAGFLTTERMALHGVSPEVYDQNRAILWYLGDIAARLGEGVLGVQLFGSRAAGYSCLESDIDINVIAPDIETKNVAEGTIIDEMKASMPELLTENVAAIFACIAHPVPVDRVAFTAWVMKGTGTHSIFGDGVVRSKSLLLMRLAALDVIYSQASSYTDMLTRYRRIRDDHDRVFLGDLPRAQMKWAKRLGIPLGEVEAVTTDAYQTRLETFGLPSQVANYRAQLAAWAAKEGDDLKGLQTYDLYRSVLPANA